MKTHCFPYNQLYPFYPQQHAFPMPFMGFPNQLVMNDRVNNFCQLPNTPVGVKKEIGYAGIGLLVYFVIN